MGGVKADQYRSQLNVNLVINNFAIRSIRGVQMFISMIVDVDCSRQLDISHALSIHITCTLLHSSSY